MRRSQVVCAWIDPPSVLLVLSCRSSALDQKRQSFVAVKKAEGVFEHRSLAKRTLRELKLMRLFRHENILGLERVMRPHSTAFSSIYLVSELMETDLACVIRSPQELTDEHCQVSERREERLCAAAIG